MFAMPRLFGAHRYHPNFGHPCSPTYLLHSLKVALWTTLRTLTRYCFSVPYWYIVLIEALCFFQILDVPVAKSPTSCPLKITGDKYKIK